MLWTKSCRPLLLGCALWCVALAAFAPAASAADNESFQDAAEEFLRELGVPAATRAQLLASGVTETESGTYSFAAGESPADRDEDVRLSLARGEGERQLLRARRNLVWHLMERRVDRKRYLDSAALGDALYARYGVISGSQSASGTLGAWIMALVWLDPTAARGIRETPPPRTEELDDGYCASLYRRAKNLLDARRWDEALPVFRHIHDLRWVNIPMYLDAAECFLRNEDVGESLKLLRELRRDLDDALGSLDLERAGRLFRAAGDRQEALASFQEARKRYRLGK